MSSPCPLAVLQSTKHTDGLVISLLTGFQDVRSLCWSGVRYPCVCLKQIRWASSRSMLYEQKHVNSEWYLTINAYLPALENK